MDDGYDYDANGNVAAISDLATCYDTSNRLTNVKTRRLWWIMAYDGLHS